MSDGIILGVALLLLLALGSDEPTQAAPPVESDVEKPTTVRIASEYSRDELEQLVVTCCAAVGASASVLAAHCDIETAGWDASAANLVGGDGARGGAYGIPQITLRTARAVDDRVGTNWQELDPGRTGDSLLAHPELAILLAAHLVAENEARVRRAGGTVQDVASLYNSGRFLREAPSSTRAYVEKFMRAYEARVGSRAWS
jgi:hypothetical protein